ncbi:MAG: NlpC/P60 family protein [Candidatus Micrarchaeia archaeon]
METQTQKIDKDMAYALERELIRKSFTNELARKIEKKVMDVVKSKMDINSVVDLQKYLNKELRNTSLKLNEDGIFGKNTLVALFAWMEREAYNGNKKVAGYLRDIRQIAYPYIDDTIANKVLYGNRKVFLEYMGVRTVAELQNYLVESKFGDYASNQIEIDGIFGKRTFFAFVSGVLEEQPVQVKKVSPIPRLVAKVEKKPASAREQIEYLSKEDISTLPLDENTKKQISELLGKPYRYGGASPKHGFDCSGLVAHLFEGVLKEYNRYPSTTYIYNGSTHLVKDYDFSESSYPLIISASKTVLDTEHGHVVIDYGIIEKDGKKHHMIFESSSSKGGVVFSLVPEDTFEKKFNKYRVLDIEGYKSVVDTVKKEEEKKKLAFLPKKKA